MQFGCFEWKELDGHWQQYTGAILLRAQ